MDEFARHTINRDVANSLKFYMMLSIFLAGKCKTSDEVASRGLKTFIKEGKEWHNGNDEIIAYYLFHVYQQIPSEFLSVMEIPVQHEGAQAIKIIDNNMRRWT